MCLTYLTDAFYHGDTFKYIRSVILYEDGVNDRFLEFSHILWRPLGYALHQLTLQFPESVVGSGTELQITYCFLFLSWVGGLFSTHFLFKCLDELHIGQFAKCITIIIVLFSNSFLNFSQAGSAYIFGFSMVLSGMFYLLRHSRTNRTLDLILCALMLGLSVCFWIPYLWSLPACVLMPLIVYGFTQKRVKESMIVGSVVIFFVAAVFLTVIYILKFEPLKALQDWVAFSQAAVQQLTGVSRVMFGLPKSCFNMLQEGSLIKRYLLHDIYNPVSLIELFTGGLWKVALYYCALLLTLCSLFVYKKSRRQGVLVVIGLLPMLIFATRFDGAANERYFPLLPYFFLSIAFVLSIPSSYSFLIRLTKSTLYVFIAACVLVNIGVMNNVSVNMSRQSVESEMADLLPQLKPNSTILTVTLDDFVDYKTDVAAGSLRRSSLFSPYPIAELNTSLIETWKQDLAKVMSTSWKSGGDVWVRGRLLKDSPDIQTRWVEGSDARISWMDIRNVIKLFSTEKVKGIPESLFVQIPRSTANIAMADSLVNIDRGK